VQIKPGSNCVESLEKMSLYVKKERKKKKKKKRRRPEVGDCPLSVVVGLGRTCSKNGRILQILSKNYNAFFHCKSYIYDLIIGCFWLTNDKVKHILNSFDVIPI
jgi:hypothetical protein